MTNIWCFENKWTFYKGYHEHGTWVTQAYRNIYVAVASPLAYSEALDSVRRLVDRELGD